MSAGRPRCASALLQRDTNAFPAPFGRSPKPPSQARRRYACFVSEAPESNLVTASDVVERAASAYRALADLAETVEDEWQYVNDLVDAYLPSVRALATENEGRPLSPAQAAAVDEAIAEVALISDPHKAIDWLSTFPHVVALALGGEVDSPAGVASKGVGSEPAGADAPEPDEDSPFRILRRGDR